MLGAAAGLWSSPVHIAGRQLKSFDLKSVHVVILSGSTRSIIAVALDVDCGGCGAVVYLFADVMLVLMLKLTCTRRSRGIFPGGRRVKQEGPWKGRHAFNETLEHHSRYNFLALNWE